jgi:hypothetical protein
LLEFYETEYEVPLRITAEKALRGGVGKKEENSGGSRAQDSRVSDDQTGRKENRAKKFA